MVKFWQIISTRINNRGQTEYSVAIPNRDYLGAYNVRWIDENFISSNLNPLEDGETRAFGSDWLIIGGATDDTVVNLSTWQSAQPIEGGNEYKSNEVHIAQPLRTQTEINAVIAQQKAEQAAEQALLTAPIESSQVLAQKWAGAQSNPLAAFQELTTAASHDYVSQSTATALNTMQSSAVTAYNETLGIITTPAIKKEVSTPLLIAGLFALFALGGSK